SDGLGSNGTRGALHLRRACAPARWRWGARGHGAPAFPEARLAQRRLGWQRAVVPMAAVPGREGSLDTQHPATRAAERSGDFAAQLGAWQARTEAALAARLPPESAMPERLHAAMRYAVLGGGKRV